MSGEALFIFAKAPRPGQIKTRLASELGAALALAAYQELLGALAASLGVFPAATVVFTPADAEAELRRFFPSAGRFLPQPEGDLGARMLATLRAAHQGGSTRAVIIGSDCPFIDPEDIHQAWAALQSVDVVFGPAEDGGYWLVGARRTHPELFSGIDWGSERVLEQNLARCAALGMTTALLRTLHDIDTAADWRRYLASR